jgi:hypothetical protein
MYGLVNKAIVDLVQSRFGPETWERIRQRAGVELDDFVSLESYPDELTYGLVSAACQELKLAPEQVLEAFGEHWVRYVGTQGYGQLLRGAGNDLIEVLMHLDSLHTRVGMSFPQLRPPSFSCEEVEAGVARLQYHSTREGLTPMVIGLLKGLGQLFQTQVEVTQTRHKGSGCAHDEFLIRTRPTEMGAGKGA